MTQTITSPTFDLGQRPTPAITHPRPIFVIGSMRSGASLLTLCLGQHPHIRQVAENGWFGNFADRLQQSFLDATAAPATSHIPASGIDVEDFFARFGESIDQLMVGAPPVQEDGYQPRRWVDGTTANSTLVFPLLRLFPLAKFIHVLRDVNDVVASLTDPDNRAVYKSHFIHMTAAEAYEHWRKSVLACVTAEQAFGSATVLRVRRMDLVAEPDATIRRCLDFLGEPFSANCLRPFR
jgi:hypothetical protein